MRILVLGGTSPSGIAIIYEFFKVYPDGSIIAYARNPSKFPQEISSNPAVTIIKGELTEIAALTSAFEDHGHIDAVLSALGPLYENKGTPIADAYASLLPIMHSHNCKRIVALSTISAEDAHDRFSLLRKLIVIIVWLVASNMYKEVIALTNVVRSEGDKYDIDWTLARVPLLHMAEKHDVVEGYVGDGKTGSFLSRWALGQFFVHEIEGKEWVRKLPVISSHAQ